MSLPSPPDERVVEVVAGDDVVEVVADAVERGRDVDQRQVLDCGQAGERAADRRRGGVDTAGIGDGVSAVFEHIDIVAEPADEGIGAEPAAQGVVAKPAG